jgi:hypothetical protein
VPAIGHLGGVRRARRGPLGVRARRMDYLRSLLGAFCIDPDDLEARRMLAYSLLVGNHFIAADHGGRSRNDVLELALRHLAVN